MDKFPKYYLHHLQNQIFQQWWKYRVRQEDREVLGALEVLVLILQEDPVQKRKQY